MNTTVLYPAETPPDTCREVLCKMLDGSLVLGFYWRPEKLWYGRYTGKRKKDAIRPVEWAEIDRELSGEDKPAGESPERVG